MSISMISSVFTGNNQSGASRVYAVGASERLRKVDRGSMSASGIFRNLSSATVYSSSRADATHIFFGNLLGFFDQGDFNGSFVQIANRRNAGSELDVNLSAHAFNNQPHSMMLVSARKDTDEFRLSLRDIFLNPWRSTIDAQLAGTQASRKGNPTLTWEMWPSGISHLSSSEQYLKIHQRLNIDISWWPDYDASLTYHVRLYLDGSGRLRSYVARWAWWVEGGIKSGAIGDRLGPQVEAGMGALNAELTSQLSPFSSVRFEDMYFLPGNQTSRPPTGITTGTTLDDVTIVLDL